MNVFNTATFYENDGKKKYTCQDVLSFAGYLGKHDRIIIGAYEYSANQYNIIIIEDNCIMEWWNYPIKIDAEETLDELIKKITNVFEEQFHLTTVHENYDALIYLSRYID